MKRSLFLFPLFAVAALSAEEPFDASKLHKIFNGKNLHGWHGNNPHTTDRAKEGNHKSLKAQQAEFVEHWKVEDGAFVNDGHGPYATTNREYGDIEFTVDYKTVPKADSGIYLRGTPQVQIWDHTNEDAFKHGADKGSGGLWNNNEGNPGKDPLALVDKPFGEWNQFHIRQIGARTWVWLNGKLVVDRAIMDNYWDRDLPLASSGPIHLQTHGGEISWKNIAVREIPGDEANQLLRGSDEGFTSIFNGNDLTGWGGPLENYEVVDGAITCKPGKGGTIYHEDLLSDFVVRLEFKVPENGNNGLAIRYPGEGNPAYDAMCELQVLDNTGSKYATLDPRQFHGGAYGIAAAHVGYLRPVGEWNYQEVTVVGSTVKVELNGTVILDEDLSSIDPEIFMAGKEHPGLALTEGYLGFAGHNDPVQFRNIAVKKLK